jgi:hypothetical protein
LSAGLGRPLAYVANPVCLTLAPLRCWLRRLSLMTINCAGLSSPSCLSLVQFTLHAVREMLAAEVAGAAAGSARAVNAASCAQIDRVLLAPLLARGAAAGASEVGRRLLGECLGAMVLLEPAHMLPRLRATLSESDAAAQQQALAALQTFVAEASLVKAQLSHLGAVCDTLLVALEPANADPGVALAAVQALNALVHHHPRFVDHTRCAPTWAATVRHMAVRADLKRVVDLGPFKQKIDDGLVVRKAAYTCAATLLHQLPPRLTLSCGGPPGEGFLAALVTAIVAGLKETEYDARILCQQVGS